MAFIEAQREHSIASAAESIVDINEGYLPVLVGMSEGKRFKTGF